MAMENTNIKKTDLLKYFSLKKNKWLEIKGRDHDVTHENFISDVIWVLDWVMNDIETM